MSFKTVMVDATPIEGTSAGLFKNARIGFLGRDTDSGLSSVIRALPKTKVPAQIPVTSPALTS